MKERIYLIGRWMTVFIFCIVTAIYAGTKAEDVIKMENKGYQKHTKPIVNFSHKKHTEEYKIGCGDCHHDKDNKPLTLKAGDSVQNCIECHKKAGYVVGKDASGLSDKQKLEYHANAVHKNCIDCHKKHNKDKNLGATDPKAAPVVCNSCHKK